MSQQTVTVEPHEHVYGKPEMRAAMRTTAGMKFPHARYCTVPGCPAFKVEQRRENP